MNGRSKANRPQWPARYGAGLAAAGSRGVRLLQVIAVVVCRGLVPLAWSRVARRFLKRRRQSREYDPSVVIERLGPAFIKFAQIASTREDMLPPGVCSALSRLHDRVTPMPSRDLERSLIAAYGDEWERRLGGVAPTPLGAGSIACAYSVAPPGQEVVALKLRRPALARRMRRDIDLVVTACRIAERLPVLRRAPLGEMAGAVGAAVLGQLDMTAESRNLAQLNRDLAGLDFVTVPRPIPGFATEHGFAMTYVPGADRTVTVDEIAECRRQVLAEQVLRAVFEMLFSTGMVHCDLHPGNLRLNAHGSITILDAGFVYQVPARTRRLLATFFLNLGFRNGSACADAVMSSAAAVHRDGDVEAFRTDIVRLVDRYGGATAREFDLVEFTKELFGSQRRNGIFASSEFAFPLLALLMVENTVRRLDPDVDFQALVRPIVFRAAQGLPAGEAARRDAEHRTGRGFGDQAVGDGELHWSASWGLSAMHLEYH